MPKKILQFLDERLHLIFAIMLGIQFLGVVSVLMIGWFLAAASGGLDILEYDPPGLSETCIMLPILFPFTVISFAIYPRIEGWKLANWLLIITTILNVILAFQIIRFLYAHFR